jgi:hypothetical protein
MDININALVSCFVWLHLFEQLGGNNGFARHTVLTFTAAHSYQSK